jgi:hypothetical protein
MEKESPTFWLNCCSISNVGIKQRKEKLDNTQVRDLLRQVATRYLMLIQDRYRQI